jgi:hypothetical protein
MKSWMLPMCDLNLKKKIAYYFTFSYDNNHTPGIIFVSTSFKISSHFSPSFGASFGSNSLRYPGSTSGVTRLFLII